MDPELADLIASTRSQLKAARNILRSTLQIVAELDERLSDLNPQPEEAQGNEHHGRRVAAVG